MSSTGRVDSSACQYPSPCSMRRTRVSGVCACRCERSSKSCERAGKAGSSPHRRRREPRGACFNLLQGTRTVHARARLRHLGGQVGQREAGAQLFVADTLIRRLRPQVAPALRAGCMHGPRQHARAQWSLLALADGRPRWSVGWKEGEGVIACVAACRVRTQRGSSASTGALRVTDRVLSYQRIESQAQARAPP